MIMRRFKNNCLAILLPFAGLLATGLFATTALADIEETIEKSYRFDPQGKIQLSNVNGNVSIKACDCEQVSLTANIIASDQETRDRIEIVIKDSSDKLSIKTKYKQNNGFSWRSGHSSVNYTLTVPDKVKLNDIELVNGNLEIEGIQGEINAELVNGNLNSDGLAESTKIEMVNGDAEIHFANLKNVDRVSIESVNGNIELYLPDNADASIDAETVSGRISNEFDLAVIKHKYVGSEMSGVLGNGNTRIDLENVNGRISVKRD